MSPNNLDEMVPGVSEELKRQTAFWAARLILNFLGAALVSLGVFSHEQVSTWIDNNIVAIAGVLVAIIGAAISYLNTRRNVVKVGVATGLPPVQPGGRQTTVDDVRKVIKGEPIE